MPMNAVSRSSSPDQAVVAFPTAEAAEIDRQSVDRKTEITYVTTHLPYPIDAGGGAIFTHSVIQTIAASASISVVVLTGTRHSDERIDEAKKYYAKFCRSLTCHTFAHLNPSSSPFGKAWHYLTGYPRQGFWSRKAEAKLIEQIRKTHSTVLWCNTTHEAKYLRAAKQIGCRTVLTTQNVESDLIRQRIDEFGGKSKLKQWVRWHDLRRLEKLGARWADVVTAVTDVDFAYYRRLKKADQVFLLPESFVIRDETFSADAAAEEPNTICFVGSMDWHPNVVAARYLVKEIMPLVWKALPEAKCFLVGRNAGEDVRTLASDKIIVTGTVASVREYYQRSPVVAVPIVGVGGVKLKLMEAMAEQKAVVSTSAGAAGLNVKHGRHLMIADDAQKFADAMAALLGDEKGRWRLGAEARRFVSEHLSPKQSKAQVDKILACLKQL